MSLLDQMIAAADLAEGPSRPPAAVSDPPAADPAPPSPPAAKTRKPRAKKDPAAPPRKRKAAAKAPPSEEEDIFAFADAEDEVPPRPPQAAVDLGDEFEEILAERKPQVLRPSPEAEAKPRLRPVEGSRVQARRDALIARLGEIQEAVGDGEPSEEAREELGAIFGELDELEGGPDPEADPFGGLPPAEPEDAAEREKLVAAIGALAALNDRELPRGWQKKPSTELRSLQLQLKQEKQSSVVRNIVHRGYFAGTGLIECVGPMIPVGERGLEVAGLTACLEGDKAVLEALDLVSLELEQTYQDYMSPWTLLAVATAAAVSKLHSTNRSIRLAARDIPPDLEARLRRIKPPAPAGAPGPAAPSPATPPAPAVAAAPPPPAIAQTGAKPSSIDGFRNLGFK